MKVLGQPAVGVAGAGGHLLVLDPVEDRLDVDHLPFGLEVLQNLGAVDRGMVPHHHTAFPVPVQQRMREKDFPIRAGPRAG